MTTTQSGTGWGNLQQFLKDNPGFRVYDFSQLETWSGCPRRYEYLYRHELDSPVGVPALFSKHCLHPLVGMFYQRLEEGQEESILQESIAYYDRFTEVLRNCDYEPAALKYSAVYTQVTLDLCLHKLVDQFERDRGLLKWYATELLCWRVLPNVPNAVWVTKPDIVLQRPDGKLITMDVKLSAYDIHSNLNAFDRQFLSQAWGAQAQYMCKLFFHVNLDTRGKLKGVTINRSIITPEDDQLAEWLAETQETVSQIQSNEAHNCWPKRSPRSCYDFNKPCPFLQLCELGSARMMAMENYTKRDSLGYLAED